MNLAGFGPMPTIKESSKKLPPQKQSTRNNLSIQVVPEQSFKKEKESTPTPLRNI